MSVREKPSLDNNFHIAHAQLLADSYHRLTKKELLGTCAREDLARELFEAPFGLVSHGTDSNPVFNYGNSTALAAFEMEWADFVCLASRDSAEAVNQEERELLMTKVKRDGYIDNYRGIRISAKGRRFWIERATIWNVIDGAGIYCGQAAVFFLEE
ncbi:MAG: MEKHLA domain-containing protein [Pseudohongiella sp.]|nr:MAG: MEKHLA domain-containing protein [Pseudohongiella sp.]